MKFITLIILLHVLYQPVTAKEIEDLSLLNIHRIGPTQLQAIKNSEHVEWWVEMGDRLIIATKQQNFKQLPKHFNIISTHQQVDLANLSILNIGHCNHTLDEQSKIHDYKPLFEGQGFQVINHIGQTNSALSGQHKEINSTHNQLLPFVKNQVISFELENREVQTSASQQTLQMLADQVNKSRWFSQVEYLAGLNRMLDEDLIIAGEWIEELFNQYGLTTSRVDLTDQRGFNILGFKTGTVRADEWYVIGAHLDSRNSNFNDNNPSPGAEDNASGCSGVIEIANIMSQYSTEASVLFVCFVGEERGLLGSRDVVLQLQLDGNIDKVKGMLNMDMISYRGNGNNTAIAGTNTVDFISIAEQVAQNGLFYTDINWTVSTSMCCTDFLRFSERGIPAVTSNQPNILSYFGYHTINDVPGNLDLDLGSGIVKANLITLAELSGLDLQSSSGFEIQPTITGSWYNPDQSGHGLNIEILDDNRILAFWYTYDNTGNQVWLLGLGDYDGATAQMNVTITENGMFPPNFISEDVINSQWGTFILEFSDCNSAQFTWQPVEEVNFTNGSMPISRLTSISGLTCQ